MYERQAKDAGFTLIELMIVVAIFGILASVAIPAYQDYIASSQVTEAINLIGGLKTPVSEAMSQSLTCSTTGAVTTGKYFVSVTATAAGVPPNETCALVAKFAPSNVSQKLANQTVTLTYKASNGSWTSSTSLPPEVAPKSC